MTKKQIEVARTTLPIFYHKEEHLNIYSFDASACTPPEPMVNTIITLALLKSKNDRLKVIYFHEPFPLYERVSDKYLHTSKELDNGEIEVLFQLIQ